MGFIISKQASKRFLYGTEIEDVYGKIEALYYDAQEETWNANVIFFMNKKAGENFKLIKYLRDIMLNYDEPNEKTSIRYNFKLRDSKYSIREWEIMQNAVISSFPKPIFSFTYSVKTFVFGPIELNRENVLSKVYESLLEQCEPGSISVLVDRPMEGIDGILTEFLLQAQEVKPVVSNPITNIVSG